MKQGMIEQLLMEAVMMVVENSRRECVQILATMGKKYYEAVIDRSYVNPVNTQPCGVLR